MGKCAYLHRRKSCSLEKIKGTRIREKQQPPSSGCRMRSPSPSEPGAAAAEPGGPADGAPALSPPGGDGGAGDGEDGAGLTVATSRGEATPQQRLSTESTVPAFRPRHQALAYT